MVLWFCGFVVLWFLGFLVLWFTEIESLLARMVSSKHFSAYILITLCANLFKIYNWSILQTIKEGHFKVSFPTAFSSDLPMPQLKDTLDFLGINYYNRQFIKCLFTPPFIVSLAVAPEENISEMSWEIY